LYTAILTKNATTIQAKYHLSEHTHLWARVMPGELARCSATW
jgi:hypothetical protein